MTLAMATLNYLVDKGGRLAYALKELVCQPFPGEDSHETVSRDHSDQPAGARADPAPAGHETRHLPGLGPAGLGLMRRLLMAVAALAALLTPMVPVPVPAAGLSNRE